MEKIIKSIKNKFKALTGVKWIKNNTARIEFIIEDCTDAFALNLLEVLVQFELKPVFEGRNSVE